jgi:hypothetical protein
MFNSLKFAAVAAGSFLASSAAAAPLAYLWLDARVQDSGEDYSRTVAVGSGDTIEYRVWGRMADIGTTNTNNGITRTITSLAATTQIWAGPQSPGGDGIFAMSLDIFQNPTDPIQGDFSPAFPNTDPTPMPNDSWSAIIGATGTGQLRPMASGAYHDLIRLQVGHSPGVSTMVDPEVVLTGTFTIPRAGHGPDSFIRVRWSQSGTAGGGGKLNGGTPFVITATTEARADPFIGIDPLEFASASFASADGKPTIAAAPPPPADAGLRLVLVPEPSMGLALACAGAFGLASRRRRPSPTADDSTLRSEA